MAINLASKYAKKVEERFYLDSIVAGKTSSDYDWDGVQTIEVLDIETYEPNNYKRTGSNRYGETKEVQDTKQIMTVTQDKSNSLSVDKGNNTQQMMVKNAGKVANRQIRERYVPMLDKYCLNAWANFKHTDTEEEGGKVYQPLSGIDTSLTKSNIVERIVAGETAMINEKVPMTNCYLYIGATHYAKLSLSDEFFKVEKLAQKALEKGVVGEIHDMKVVRVPDSYLPENVNFMIVKKEAVLAPVQIKDMKVHQDPPGLSGHLLEFRWIFDAFVKKNKAVGIYVSKTQAAA